MLGANGQRLVDRWKEMATQAGTRVARAVVETTVVAMRALDRLRARWLKGSPRLHPERLRAIERLWEETVAPQASQALREEAAEKTRPLRRQRPTRRKLPPRDEGRKTVQSPAPAGKSATAPASPKKADARKAGTRKAGATKAGATKAGATKAVAKKAVAKKASAKKAVAKAKQAPRRRA